MRKKPKIPDKAPVVKGDGPQLNGVLTVRNNKGDDERAAVGKGGKTYRTFNEFERRLNDSLASEDGGVAFGAADTQVVAEPSEYPDQLEVRSTSLARGTKKRVRNQTGTPDKYTDVGLAAECFVGTGDVAFAPSVAPIPDESKRKKKKRAKTESTMSTRRRLAEEGQSGVAPMPGGLKGAGHKMDSPTGDGVAARKPTKWTVGKFETDTTDFGKEWPRKHSDNIVVGAPPGGQEGDHESEHSEASDGYTKGMGEAWPRKQKNSGSGVAEPFGNSYDGAEVEEGDAPDGFGSSEPNNDGQFPKSKTVGEDWNPNNVGAHMTDSDESSLQSLFNVYVKNADVICLEDFERVLEANGVDAVVNNDSLMILMRDNRDFMFHEGVDASGRYWIAEGLPAALEKNKFKKGAKPGKSEKKPGKPFKKVKPTMDECDAACREWVSVATSIDRLLDEGKVTEQATARAMQLSFNVHMGPDILSGCSANARSAVRRIAESYGLTVDRNIQAIKEAGPDMQVGQPNHKAFLDQMGSGDDYGAGGVPANAGMGTSPYEDGYDEMEDPVYAGDATSGDIPDGRAVDPAAMAGNGEFDDPNDLYHDGHDPMADDYGSEGALPPSEFGGDMEELPADNDPSYDAGSGYDDAYDSSMPSSSILGSMNSPTRPGQPTAPGRPRPMESRRRGRRPISEDLSGAGHQMDWAMDGDSIAEDDPSTDSGLPQDDVDMKELLGKNLLGANQTNTGEGQTEFEHGGQGILGNSGEVKENIERLARSVRTEMTKAKLPVGKYSARFSVLVREGKGWNRTRIQRSLAESLADAEELLQVFGNRRVVFEAHVSRGGRSNVLRIGLPAVKRRPPMTSGRSCLFRFNRIAESFAGELLREGRNCRVTSHSWGTAVRSDATGRDKVRAFNRCVSESAAGGGS